MRLTIIPNDNMVIIDGVGAIVDLSHLPATVHAIQWDGSAGEVEYVKPANRRITSLDDIAEPNEPEGKVALSREVIDAILKAHAEAVAPPPELVE